jgi:hypothetical protein
VLSSGDGAFAWKLASEWTQWKTGHVDFSGFARRLPRVLRTIAIGAGMIGFSAFAWIWIGRRRTT